MGIKDPGVKTSLRHPCCLLKKKEKKEKKKEEKNMKKENKKKKQLIFEFLQVYNAPKEDYQLTDKGSYQATRQPLMHIHHGHSFL